MGAPLEDYGLIGDCETAALVGRDGSIDWLCWPRFDSDACFAALLGTERNGRWRLAPAAPVRRTSRRYRPNTLILETEFEAEAGAVRLTDFMPVRGVASDVVRVVEGLRGRVAMRCDLRLRFDYGNVAPWLREHADGLVAVVGPDLAVLRATVPVRARGGDAEAGFTLSAGDTARFVLTYGASTAEVPRPIDVDEALAQTQAYWLDWAGRFRTERTAWPEAVLRSLVTLKALVYRPSGGIVAAATTSLPEALGGGLNWDYRYCWLRDASFTLTALLRAGYHGEAEGWRDWLLRAVAGDPARMQIMYRLDGGRRLPEWTADWLPGYEGSAPVRIGNAAARQVQLDVYGELLAVLHDAAQAGMEIPPQAQHLEAVLAERLERVWQEPGQGIWESRGPAEQYTYSKVMAWVGVDRTLRRARAHGGMDPGALRRMEALRRRIHDEVCERGYDPALGSFVAYYGAKTLDASLLRLPLVGFLPAADPRIRGTIAAIRRDLSDGDLVLRYRADPAALGGEDSAFIACTYWLADCLALSGRPDEAAGLFEKLLSLRNDLGLLSEEYDTRRRRLVGNFPQAFSHLALVNTALALGASPPASNPPRG